MNTPHATPSPATSAALSALIASDIPPDLAHLFEQQRAAWAHVPHPSWAERADRLQRLHQLLRDHEAEITQAIDADFGGRPAIETELAEVWPSLEELKSALRHGKTWMRPRRAGVGKWFLPARAQVLPVPLGVVGVIVPWNYPLYLAIGPLVAALAAGNRVMVKMSEFTPRFSGLFQRLCAQAFSPLELAVVTGGPEVASAFSRLPWDHLLFTGSTPVGHKVMEAAAAHLTPVTLELGGKSPALITPDYPLAHAAQRILAGKLLNAGQTCIAPDYVLVPRAQLAELAQHLQAQGRRAYPQGLADPQWCSIINTRQYQRLQGLRDEALARGCTVLPLVDGPTEDDRRHRLAPSVVLDPPLDSVLMQQEIFGPLLPLLPYDDLETALAWVRSRPRPLALYWFDHDRARTREWLPTLPAGGVTVNDTLMHIAQDSLPFGGVGASGMGHYHGRWGFDTFSKLMPVFHQARLNGGALFAPPYSPLMRTLLGWMKRL